MPLKERRTWTAGKCHLPNGSGSRSLTCRGRLMRPDGHRAFPPYGVLLHPGLYGILARTTALPLRGIQAFLESRRRSENNRFACRDLDALAFKAGSYARSSGYASECAETHELYRVPGTHLLRNLCAGYIQHLFSFCLRYASFFCDRIDKLAFVHGTNSFLFLSAAESRKTCSSPYQHVQEFRRRLALC